MKLARWRALWHTGAGAGLVTAFGITDMEEHETHDAIEIHWLMGVLGPVRSTSRFPHFDLVKTAEGNIRNGLVAIDASRAT